MEHAWGDGVAVLRYFNEIFKETTEKPLAHPDTKPSTVDSASVVRKLGINRLVTENESVATKLSAFYSLVELLF